MNNWIDDTVIIDFPVPKDVKNLMDMCEVANANGDWGYFNYEESLDYICKEAVVQGHMTDREWNEIRKRYESYD